MKNQYHGKNVEQVWNEWTADQRMHFIQDHTSKQHTPASIEEISKRTFRFIPSDIRSELIDHVMTGQYKKGGTPGKKYGIYVYGNLHDSYSDELVARAAMHSLKAIHPGWKIEVKPLKKSEYKHGGQIFLVKSDYPSLLQDDFENQINIAENWYNRNGQDVELFRQHWLSMAKADEKAGNKDLSKLKRDIVKMYVSKQPNIMGKGGLIDFGFLTQKVSFTELFTK